MRSCLPIGEEAHLANFVFEVGEGDTEERVATHGAAEDLDVHWFYRLDVVRTLQVHAIAVHALEGFVDYRLFKVSYQCFILN